ncbi:MAG: hypothetical protein GC204_14545 [Chloroflexi bacterium]|nr:hypothetical protein [Chloroflexota bacterium]
MIRVWLWLVAALTVVFALMISVIQAQPRSDEAVRDLFAVSSTCAAPCFMGIRPGVTTRDEALAILRQHRWVRFVNPSATSISWTWNGSQPALIDGYAALQLDVQQTVTQIKLVLDYPLGNFLSVFGSPAHQAQMIASATSTHGYLLVFDGFYSQLSAEIETITSCPLKSATDLWYSTVSIIWLTQNPVVERRLSRFKSC